MAALARQIEARLKAKNMPFIALLILLFLSATPAYANVGIPMLVIVWPMFWLAFILIVLIEYWILKKL